MKPKPLVLSNHLTVPVIRAIYVSLRTGHSERLLNLFLMMREGCGAWSLCAMKPLSQVTAFSGATGNPMHWGCIHRHLTLGAAEKCIHRAVLITTSERDHH